MLERVPVYYPAGHFRHSPAVHTTSYFHLNALRGYEQESQALSTHIATLFKDEEPQVILTPGAGAIFLAKMVAYQFWQLSSGNLRVRTASVLENQGAYYINSGERPLNINGKRVLLFVGVCAQPKRLWRILHAIRELEGIPAGVGVLCLRSETPLQSLSLGVGSHALYHLPTTFHSTDVCPDCIRDIPLTPIPGL